MDTNINTDAAADFPDVVSELRDIVYHKFSDVIDDDFKFDQCIINRYLPGQGIGEHVDDKKYGPYVASFTIESEMEFNHPDTKNRYKQFVKPGSVYLMSGESRSTWTHQMRARKTDRGF
jgi:alkylated DNA repair dioxygenase AlkB